MASEYQLTFWCSSPLAGNKFGNFQPKPSSRPRAAQSADGQPNRVMEGEFLLMDALVATFKPQNPNFLAGFVPKFQCQIQAQNSNFLFKGVLRGLPYANFPLKSTGKNIVSVQRRCSIIYSSLQLLQLLPTRRKERSRAV